MNADEEFDRYAIPVYTDADGAEAIPPEYRGREKERRLYAERRRCLLFMENFLAPVDEVLNKLVTEAEERGEIKPYIQKLPPMGGKTDE